MKAKLKVIDSINDISSCDINGHHFEFGGVGDGYCYEHQSFDCLDTLTDEEKEAIGDGEWET